MISSDHLAPGAVGQIRTTVDTANRIGHLAKRIAIISNDRTNPVVSVEVVMNVVQK